MNISEYQKKAMVTCMPSCHNEAYMLHNLIGEVGETCEKIVDAAKLDEDNNCVIDDWLQFVQLAQRFGKRAKRLRKEESSSLEIDANEIRLELSDISNEAQEEIKKELGDILWQLSGLCSVLKIDLEDVARTNLEKLASRKRRGVIDGNGDNR